MPSDRNEPPVVSPCGVCGGIPDGDGCPWQHPDCPAYPSGTVEPPFVSGSDSRRESQRPLPLGEVVSLPSSRSRRCPGGPAVFVNTATHIAQCPGGCDIWFDTWMDEPVLPPHTVTMFVTFDSTGGGDDSRRLHAAAVAVIAVWDAADAVESDAMCAALDRLRDALEWADGN